MPVKKPKKRLTFSSISVSVSVVSVVSLLLLLYWRTTDTAVAQGRLDQKQDGELVRVEQKVDAHTAIHHQDMQAIQSSVKDVRTDIKYEADASQNRHSEIMKIMLDKHSP